jgi:valyl-tRNA synthetase
MRRVRAEYNVAPGKVVDALVVAPAPVRQMLDEERALVSRLGRTSLAFATSAPKGAGASVILRGGTELVVPLEGLVDVKKECARLKGELASLVKQLTSLESRLENPGFVERAPAHVIDSERAKRDEWSARRDQLTTRIEGLCGSG